jgi:hypothetical protein
MKLSPSERARLIADDITPHTATLDGKRIAYSSETEFLVQVGRGKGAYSTRFRFRGNLGQAVFHFRCINIGNGYKKRLLMNDQTLARQFST